LIRSLDEYHVEASVIDIDAVPAVSKLTAGEGCGLLLDIGHKDTTGVLFREGRIFHIRHFSFGGASITGALANALKIEFPEAEAKKERVIQMKPG